VPRVSKITNDGLKRSGTGGCFIATVPVKELNNRYKNICFQVICRRKDVIVHTVRGRGRTVSRDTRKPITVRRFEMFLCK